VVGDSVFLGLLFLSAMRSARITRVWTYSGLLENGLMGDPPFE